MVAVGVVVMSRILSVSCDDAFFHELDKHLRKVGVPRSVFIRNAVRIAMRGSDGVSAPKHTAPLEERVYGVREGGPSGVCNPNYSRGAPCLICWPDGWPV